MDAIITLITIGVLVGIITTSIFAYLTKEKPVNPTQIVPFLISDNSLQITINSEEHQNNSEFFVLDTYNDELLEIWKQFFNERVVDSVIVNKITKPLNNQKNIFVVIIK